MSTACFNISVQKYFIKKTGQVMTFFLLLISSIVFLTAVYLFFFVKRIVSLFTDKKGISRIWAIAILLSVGGTCIYLFRYTAVILMLHLVFAGLICQIISFILRKTVKNVNFQKKRNIIYKAGIVPICITLLIGVFGYCNMVNVVKTEYNYKTDKWDRGKNLKVAMISDLHMGTTMDTETLQKHMDKISEEKPDVFLLVGDIVDESTTRKQMIDTFDILSNVKSRDGVFYVYGNHDRNIYGNHKNFTDKELTRAIVDSGIKILRDNIAEFDDYVIVGREDRSAENEIYSRKDIKTLLEYVDKSKYIINLDHQPRELKKCSEAGVDLQLSGHTHGGQIWPAGIIAEKTGIFELTYGEKILDTYTAITSSGIASWGYPIRTEQHSEYVIVNIDGNK